MKRVCLLLSCILFLSGCSDAALPAVSAGFSASAAEQWTPSDLRDSSLKVYMVMNEDLAMLLADLFEERTGCKVSYAVLSSEEALKALLENADSPEVDVLLGGSVDIHETLKSKGLLTKYMPYIDNSQSGRYADYGKFWNAVCLECLSVGTNTGRLKEKYGLSKCPSTLEELADPKFAGDIVMSEPDKSNIGYLFFASVLANYGAEEGYGLLQKVMKNIEFKGNDLQAAQRTGFGEKTFVIGSLSEQLRMKSSGLPIECSVYENSGWTIIPVSMIEGNENTDAAESFINFVLTEEIGKLIAEQNYSFPIRDSIEAPYGVSHSVSAYPIGAKFNPVKHFDKREYAQQLYEKWKSDSIS